jgi:hypothetical protein
MADSSAETNQTNKIGNASEPRRLWEVPTVSRLSAGAAEVGYEANVADGNFSQS